MNDFASETLGQSFDIKNMNLFHQMFWPICHEPRPKSADLTAAANMIGLSAFSLSERFAREEIKKSSAVPAAAIWKQPQNLLARRHQRCIGRETLPAFAWKPVVEREKFGGLVPLCLEDKRRDGGRSQPATVERSAGRCAADTPRVRGDPRPKAHLPPVLFLQRSWA
jgi:hypothetical protein